MAAWSPHKAPCFVFTALPAVFTVTNPCDLQHRLLWLQKTGHWKVFTGGPHSLSVQVLFLLLCFQVLVTFHCFGFFGDSHDPCSGSSQPVFCFTPSL